MDHWTYPWREMRKAIHRHNRSTNKGGLRRDDYFAAVQAAGKVMIAWTASQEFDTCHLDRMLIGLHRRLQSMIDYEAPPEITEPPMDIFKAMEKAIRVKTS